MSPRSCVQEAIRSLVVDNIGLLVTNDPALGDGPLGVVRDAALVIEAGRVAAIEPAGAAADARIDAGGRCVIPGFVDSHTHLVFAGDRAEEFAARMAGAPYAAGGIRVTVEATRAATTEELRALPRLAASEALQAGITHVEIKSGYALDVERRAAPVRARRRAHRGRHVSRRPLCSRPSTTTRPDDYVALVCGRDAGGLRSARALDRRLLRAGRVRRRSVARGACRPAGTRGLGLRVHAQPARPGPGVQLAVELGAASADHCTYLSDDDVEALASSDTVATLLPATDFSTRQPYPDARRLSMPVHGRARHQLQSGLELYDLDAVLPRPGGAGDCG